MKVDDAADPPRGASGQRGWPRRFWFGIPSGKMTAASGADPRPSGCDPNATQDDHQARRKDQSEEQMASHPDDRGAKNDS